MDENRAAAPSTVALLIETVGLGSRVALKRLYELESQRLYGVALRIVRRPEIASEVLQEAFLQVWLNAQTFSAERGAASAWLTGIVRFRAIDAVRKIRREILVDDPTLGDALLEPDVIEKIDAKAEAIALRRCLALLDENQRRCVVLAFVDGYSHAEIAQRLASPLGSVKSWVRRGLLTLRSCLES
jgi:RNA polymerase sigma-70 factor (ECF subfamily)